ncbi:hypothetical protein chiPu_0021036 [Chiloscyllium punctatum]|uniref:Uncharacterized protein n=1 Tax=Chiloscyllium punctatum TaxID=137246 RepID=A0A401RMD7_CHIPU|nr:hypothetical protein [Chiloscyllium punctatum]
MCLGERRICKHARRNGNWERREPDARPASTEDQERAGHPLTTGLTPTTVAGGGGSATYTVSAWEQGLRLAAHLWDGRRWWGGALDTLQ